MNALTSFFGGPWVEHLGGTLIHFLWQGLLIAVLYGATREIWFRRKGPNARYCLACAALAAMLGAPAATFLASHPAGPVISGTPYFARPVSGDSSPVLSKAPGPAPEQPPTNAPARRARKTLKWFVLFWATGVVAFSLRLISGWLAVTRMRLSRTQPAPGEWQDRLSRLSCRIGVSQPVLLLVSALVKSPSVAGWLRPVILVPVGALTGLPVDYMESLLLHELAHIRRCDYLVNLLQSVGEALLFYHPAVWWVSGHIRAERELCCDDAAASACGDALTYAKALTAYARTLLTSPGPAALSTTVAVDGGSLPERIARLLGTSPARETRTGPAGLIVTALLLTLTAFGPFAQSPASALSARDITGTWQGTLHSTRDIREVIKISKDGNILKAVLFGIDSQPGQSFPSLPVTFQGNAIKIQFPGIGGAYQGTPSADGNSIAGSFSQGATTMTLGLVRATAETAWEIPAAPLPEKAMATDANPSFEVASIKLSPPNARGSGSGMDPGGRFTAHNMSLRGLMLLGYGLHPRQIEGGPAWFETDRFDIVAKADTAGAPNKAQVMTMVQKLLADRFGLRLHREKKELAIYAITLGKPASRLTPSTGDPNGLPTARLEGLGHFTARNMNMKEFAEGLQGTGLDRPVIDQTGLSGRFDFTLNWTPDEFQFPSLGVNPSSSRH